MRRKHNKKQIILTKSFHLYLTFSFFYYEEYVKKITSKNTSLLFCSIFIPDVDSSSGILKVPMRNEFINSWDIIVGYTVNFNLNAPLKYYLHPININS